MFDLLTSLIRPTTPSIRRNPTTPKPASPPPMTTSNIHAAASQDAGLPIYDADTFLNEPSNQALANSGASKKRIGSDATAATQPVQLASPRTSYAVSALHHLCQERGLKMDFEIEGDKHGFGGWLKVGNEMIGRDERWRSKKDAKEGLAERGLEVVKAMPLRGKVTASSQENWIGMLQNFYQSSVITLEGGPVYTEFAIGMSFACTCTIPARDAPFGSDSLPFPTKKAARFNAAREAMQFLIAEGLTEPDGSVKAKKKVKVGTAVRIGDKRLEVKKDATYAQKVNELCSVLCFQPPTYHLQASSPATPSMLSGFAKFSNEPLFPDPIGEVRNLFGRKAAKEECARGVWKVLMAEAAKRGVGVGIEDEGDGDEGMEGI